MTTPFTFEPGAGLADDQLPGYARMLHAYHCALSAELRAIIAALPIAPGARVLDVACGDGCYSMWLAKRAGAVVGVDLSPAYLDHAQEYTAGTPHASAIS